MSHTLTSETRTTVVETRYFDNYVGTEADEKGLKETGATHVTPATASTVRC